MHGDDDHRDDRAEEYRSMTTNQDGSDQRVSLCRISEWIFDSSKPLLTPQTAGKIGNIAKKVVHALVESIVSRVQLA
jgi:hypothetical protein